MVLTQDYSRVAATWSRVQGILRGLDDDVDQFGIMTAWNPESRKGEKPIRWINKLDNAELLQDLRALKLSPIKVVGKFKGIPEGSLLIPNVEREYMIELCGMYDQESVFYAEKFENERGEPGIRYELLNAAGERVAPSETVMLFSGDVDDEGEPVSKKDDNFSSFGSVRPKEDKPGQKAPSEKKFVVPFKFENNSGG